MAKKKTGGSELFIVDNGDQNWKVREYLHDWLKQHPEKGARR